MPRGDGTGPGGAGPMTGRAAGYCAGYPAPGYANPMPGGGRFGLGRGRGGPGWGRGFGRGRGFGWRGFGAPAFFNPNVYGNPYYGEPADVYPYAPELTPQQETDMLKKQAQAINDELKAINSRIGELESAAKTDKR